MKTKHVKLEHVKRHFRRSDPALFTVFVKMKCAPLVGEKDAAQYFSKLCREIISQQLGSGAAHAIHGRFLKLFRGGRVTPAQVLKVSEQELREVGMSWAKARSLLDLARRARSGEVNLSALPQLDDEAAILELCKVNGIGRWTAEMFLIFTLGREDVFSSGDLGLRRGLLRIYGKRKIKSDTHIARITERWSPYRSYACLALWHAWDSEK